MYSFSRTALLLVLALTTTLGMEAQSSSSQPEKPATPPSNQGSLSVQARIRARREQRRVAAIHDVYTHLYEAYLGTGYLRFQPGPGVTGLGALQKLNEFEWDLGVTRYFNERLGVTIDGRGAYGTAYIGPANPASGGALNKPSISEYSGMIGPTYRFLLAPKYSVSGRVLAGGVFGNFLSDANGFTAAETGLFPDGGGLAVNASIPVEYNLSPEIGLRVAPEYFLTTFGSKMQNNLGFTASLVVRWGKQ